MIVIALYTRPRDMTGPAPMLLWKRENHEQRINEIYDIAEI